MYSHKMNSATVTGLHCVKQDFIQILQYLSPLAVAVAFFFFSSFALLVFTSTLNPLPTWTILTYIVASCN